MSKIGYLFSRKSFSNFKKRFDYAEYGGALLVGVRAPVIISHGRSTADAMRNAIKMAKQCVEGKVVHHLSTDIEVSQDLVSFGKKPSLFDKLFKSDAIFKRPDTEN
jgi:fatty acid/phospholipid biosynthesis enzyme